MRHLFLAALVAGALPAFATEPGHYISSGGGMFSYTENRYGAVLEVTERQLDEMLTDSSIQPQLKVGDTLYLGRACDALSLDYGQGSWMATEGGFIVTVGEERILFPGQIIPLRTYADCRGVVTQ